MRASGILQKQIDTKQRHPTRAPVLDREPAFVLERMHAIACKLLSVARLVVHARKMGLFLIISGFPG